MPDNLLGDIIPDRLNYRDLSAVSPIVYNGSGEFSFDLSVIAVKIQAAAPTATYTGELWKDIDDLSVDMPESYGCVTQKTGHYTLTLTDAGVDFLITTAAQAALPDPTTCKGKKLDIMNDPTSTANVSFSHAINGDAAFVLMPDEVINIQSNGTAWRLYA